MSQPSRIPFEAQLDDGYCLPACATMVASVVREESLGLEEVLDILDEATQVRAYSHELEAKQRELETATTDLREANQRLRELDRMKDDFISTVTHELRTPLTSIRALSEMLHEDPKLELASRTRFLGIIVSETERLTDLTHEPTFLEASAEEKQHMLANRLEEERCFYDANEAYEKLLATAPNNLLLRRMYAAFLARMVMVP